VTQAARRENARDAPPPAAAHLISMHVLPTAPSPTTTHCRRGRRAQMRAGSVQEHRRAAAAAARSRSAGMNEPIHAVRTHFDVQHLESRVRGGKVALGRVVFTGSATRVASERACVAQAAKKILGGGPIRALREGFMQWWRVPPWRPQCRPWCRPPRWGCQWQRRQRHPRHPRPSPHACGPSPRVR